MKGNLCRGSFLLGLVIVWACLAAPLFSAEKEISDGSVATVNGAAINRGEYDREMIRARQELAMSGRRLNDSVRAEMKKRVLESLIDRELLYQESHKKGIKVEDEAVNKLYGALKNKFSSEEEFQSVLVKLNTSEADLKSEYRKRIAIQRLIAKEFAPKVSVSEEDTRSYYDNHKASFIKPEKIRVRHILIKVSPKADEATKAEARRKLKEIKGRLEKGETFEALAKAFSEDKTAARGGDLGYISRGQMVKPFEEVAFNLTPGTVSDIVETRFGYHLIEVIDYKPESYIAYEEAKEMLQKILKQRKIDKMLRSYVEKLRGKAEIKRIL
jgi:peptidyl-prolyl cis-trans isomerase C